MLDPQSLADLGLAGVFVAAFFAGSVLPFPSEAALLAWTATGGSWPLGVIVATTGNVLGAATLFAIGRVIGRRSELGVRLARRFARDPDRLERARARLDRWGPPALLLAWLPFAGDAIVLAGGLAGLRWMPFVAFVTLGKAARYVAVAAGVGAALN